jgi:hypothetical protein
MLSGTYLLLHGIPGTRVELAICSTTRLHGHSYILNGISESSWSTQYVRCDLTRLTLQFLSTVTSQSMLRVVFLIYEVVLHGPMVSSFPRSLSYQARRLNQRMHRDIGFLSVITVQHA